MDIYSLIRNQEKKKSYKADLFKKILKQAHRRIEYSAKSGEKLAIFQIPNYVIGFPLFNKSECCDYLIRELTLNGFKVNSPNDQYVYISWEHVYQKYLENTILESGNMLEYSGSNDPDDNPIDNIEKKVKKSNELIFNKPFSLFR